MNKKLYELICHEASSLTQLPLPWERLKGRRIFITGGTGFIGGYLTKAFCEINRQLSLNMELMLFHRSTAKPLFFAPGLCWIEGNIAENFIPKYFVPDIIIHSASPANKQAILSDPAGVVDCNILATHYLLERARKDHSMLLFFSSGEVCQREPGKMVEKSAYDVAQNGAISLYGNSKLVGELLCERYRVEYGVDCRILRLFSIFGPGESLTSGRCFTDFIRQARETHNVRVNGPGTQIRSHCYLSDFASGLLYVLLKGKSTVYNVGNDDNSCTILELAREIAALHGNTTVQGPFGTETGKDSFVPDTTKLRQLGWQPQINLQTCIERCLDSY